MPNDSTRALQSAPHAAGEREQAAPDEHVDADDGENGEADRDPGHGRLGAVDAAGPAWERPPTQ